EPSQGPWGGHLGNERSVAKGAMDKLILAVDTPSTVPNPADVLLSQNLGTEEASVTLGIDDLVKRAGAADAAGGKVGVAFAARKAFENEVLEVGVIGGNIKAEIALGALEPELDGIALFDNEARRADFEGL